ncbi:zinc ribbon domain-containing protein [Chloroflexota bacterium]
MMQQQMVQCPNCGRTNSPSQQFCGTCGERLQYVSPVGPVGPPARVDPVSPPSAPVIPVTPAPPPTHANPAIPVRSTAVDASQAQMAVIKYLESAYMNYLKEVHFTKCWYSHVGGQTFWDVEGFMLTTKKVGGSNEMHFRFQVDPNSGEVLGYEL